MHDVWLFGERERRGPQKGARCVSVSIGTQHASPFVIAAKVSRERLLFASTASTSGPLLGGLPFPAIVLGPFSCVSDNQEMRTDHRGSYCVGELPLCDGHRAFYSRPSLGRNPALLRRSRFARRLAASPKRPARLASGRKRASGCATAVSGFSSARAPVSRPLPARARRRHGLSARSARPSSRPRLVTAFI